MDIVRMFADSSLPVDWKPTACTTAQTVRLHIKELREFHGINWWTDEVPLKKVAALPP